MKTGPPIGPAGRKLFADSGIEILFALWFAKADFLNLKNSIMREIIERFRAENIEIPFPHRVVVQAAAAAPAEAASGGDRQKVL